MENKKTSDIKIFLLGWGASAFSIAVPLIVLYAIQKYLPDEYKSYGDKINIFAYLVGALFSGVYLTYRVSRKSDEKDLEIEELKKQITHSKIAYNKLNPKSKIIDILHEIHKKSKNLSKADMLGLIIDKIGQVNKDSSFDARYDGMFSQIESSEFKDTKISTSENKTNKTKNKQSYEIDSILNLKHFFDKT